MWSAPNCAKGFSDPNGMAWHGVRLVFGVRIASCHFLTVLTDGGTVMVVERIECEILDISAPCSTCTDRYERILLGPYVAFIEASRPAPYHSNDQNKT